MQHVIALPPAQMCDDIFHVEGENALTCSEDDPTYCACLEFCDGCPSECCILFHNRCQFIEYNILVDKSFIDRSADNICSELSIVNFDL